MSLLKSLAAAAGSMLLAAAPALAETVDFSGVAPGLQAPGSITFPGVTFSSTSGLFRVDAGVTGNALCAYDGGGCGGQLIIDFLTPASNVMFTFEGDDVASTLSFQGESATASFTGRLFADGNPLTQEMFNLSIVPNITQLVVYSNDPGGVVFDNFSFATAAGGVPEPASWAMMIVGVGAVGALSRRRGVVRTRASLA